MLEEALKEQGVEIFKADSEGFITYRSQVSKKNEKFAAVSDLYLVPEQRTLGKAKDLVDKFCAFAKEKELTAVAWGVQMQNPNKETILCQNLQLGFKLLECDKQGLVLVKQV